MLKRSLSIGARLLAALSVFALTASLGHSKGGGEGGYGSCSHGCGHSNSHRSAGGHGKKGLRRLRKADANGDGKVTLEEFTARREQRFVELHADGDGKLSLEELFKPMQAGADHKVRRMMKRYDADGDGKITKNEFAEPARKRFATRNSNGDGKISDDELPPTRGKRGGAATQPGEAGDQADAAEQGKGKKHGRKHRGRHGKHGQGARNTEEVLEYRSEKFTRYDTNDDGVIDAAEAREKGSKRREYYKRRRMHVLDTNKDGSVSKDEFLAKPTEHFSMMDLDGDGAITADDLPPRMARRWKEKTDKQN